MSITVTNPTDSAKPAGHPDPKKDPKKAPVQESPQMKSLERQQEQIQKRIDRLKKTPVTAADDPNDDPSYLSRQVRPILQKMALHASMENSKTELIPGKNKGNLSQYKVLLRRNVRITPDIIDRIQRQEDALESIEWTSDGVCMYLWAPYTAPEEAPQVMARLSLGSLIRNIAGEIERPLYA